MESTLSPSDINKLAPHPLQTSAWAEFRREWGNTVLTTKHGLITIHHIPYTKYKVGTLIRGTTPTKTMLSDLQKIAKKENLIFVKLEPNLAVSCWQSAVGKKSKKIITKNQPIIKLLQSQNAVPGKTLFTPTSFQIDLTQSENDLLKGFSSKTRYNIRYAERQGVVVKEDNSDEAFEAYIRLMRETVERQKFYAHSEKYHRLMWKHLHTNMVTKKMKPSRNASSRATSGGPIARLLTARFNDEIITAWIVFVWKDMMYYPYGASTERYKNVQANSAMMWNAILYGKKNKLTTFDLWGREEGKGFTRFKEGFNPSVVEFLGTWDLVASNLYWPYRIADYVRWKLLRLRSSAIKSQF